MRVTRKLINKEILQENFDFLKKYILFIVSQKTELKLIKKYIKLCYQIARKKINVLCIIKKS